MATNEKAIEVKQEDVLTAETTERIRDRKIFVPRTDIFEDKEGLVLVLDVPGADDKSVEITLEKNVLTINAYPQVFATESHTLAYAEYGEGDYQRSFALSDEIDRSKIEASVRNGQLTVRLHKAAEAKPQKIAIKAG